MTEVEFAGLRTRFVTRGEATAGQVAIVEHTLDPGLLGAALHTHTRETEISYVLRGTLTVQIGGDVCRVQRGGMIVKPANVPHAFWNAGVLAVQFLEIITPGGFERYFEDIAPFIPRDGPASMPDILRIAAGYGLTFDLPSGEAIMAAHGVRWGTRIAP